MPDTEPDSPALDGGDPADAAAVTAEPKPRRPRKPRAAPAETNGASEVKEELPPKPRRRPSRAEPKPAPEPEPAADAEAEAEPEEPDDDAGAAPDPEEPEAGAEADDDFATPPARAPAPPARRRRRRRPSPSVSEGPPPAPPGTGRPETVALLDALTKRAKVEDDPASAEVLADYGLLALQVRRLDDPDVHRLLMVGLAALEQGHVAAAKRIADDLQKRMVRGGIAKALFSRIFFSGWTPTTPVLWGLGSIVFCVAVVTTVLALVGSDGLIFGFDAQVIGLVALAGIFGAIVSIAVRLDEFSRAHGVNTVVLFFQGFSKPLVGAFFALFVYATLKSGLLPISVDTQEGSTAVTQDEREDLIFAAFGFIAGFSERFAPDLVRRAGGSLQEPAERPES